MIFKSNWEKTNERVTLPSGLLEAMLQSAYPTQTVKAYEIIAGGCANLNVKITAHGTREPFILRIYLRDKDAAFRESALASLLKSEIAVPLTYHIGDLEGYRFALMEYLPGITLRDLLLSDQPHDVGALSFQVGTVLAAIARHRFAMSGFFDAQLNIKQPLSQAGYLEHAVECLGQSVVIKQLGSERIMALRAVFDHNAGFFPWEQDNCLIHADFDPANILVTLQEGCWKVSAVLDWEFAYSGSPITDVANMLRYAHLMPPVYESAFLDAVRKGGILFPEHWRITMHLMNLLSLLGCLAQSDPKTQPNRCADIRTLIDVHLKPLGS